MAHDFAYVNGKIVPVAEAVVSVHDRSFLYGDGAFDTATARLSVTTGDGCIRSSAP